MSLSGGGPPRSDALRLGRYLPLSVAVTVAVTVLPLLAVTRLGPTHTPMAVAVTWSSQRCSRCWWPACSPRSGSATNGQRPGLRGPAALGLGPARTRGAAPRGGFPRARRTSRGGCPRGPAPAHGRAARGARPYTHGHSRRVARHSERIARELGLPPEQVARIRAAALVHDIGKINVPRPILTKPGRLTEEEFALVKRHPGDGAAMVAALGDSGADRDRSQPPRAHRRDRLSRRPRRRRHSARRAHHRGGRHVRRDHFHSPLPRPANAQAGPRRPAGRGGHPARRARRRSLRELLHRTPLGRLGDRAGRGAAAAAVRTRGTVYGLRGGRRRPWLRRPVASAGSRWSGPASADRWCPPAPSTTTRPAPPPATRWWPTPAADRPDGERREHDAPAVAARAHQAGRAPRRRWRDRGARDRRPPALRSPTPELPEQRERLELRLRFERRLERRNRRRRRRRDGCAAGLPARSGRGGPSGHRPAAESPGAGACPLGVALAQAAGSAGCAGSATS